MITIIVVSVLALLSCLLIYGMLSRETGFKLTKTADGKPRFSFWGTSQKGEVAKSADGKADNKEGDSTLEEGKWEFRKLLVVLLILTAAWWYDGGIYLREAAWFILAAVILNLLIYPPKGNLARRMMKIELAILLLFALVPGVKDWMTGLFHHGVTPPVIPAEWKLPQHIHSEPGWGLQKVNIPSGKIIKGFWWECSTGCILQIVHDVPLGSSPLCPSQRADQEKRIYQKHQCEAELVKSISGNIPRYQERFVVNGEGPLNLGGLSAVEYSFGADDLTGPIEVDTIATLAN